MGTTSCLVPIAIGIGTGASYGAAAIRNLINEEFGYVKNKKVQNERN